ncbi:hypothetical protein M3Y95_00785300 [Aphelenchoides besseyi]|nr:hypothetical protein M3Y95_00785300 [Aphelenchoides besseyi]
MSLESMYSNFQTNFTMFMASNLMLRSQFVIEFVFYFIAMLIQISLLYRIYTTSLYKQLSTNLIINIIFWILVSAAGSLHTGYMIRFFQFGPPYWGPAVLWTGSFYYASLTSVSITVFFLLLDRIYSLNAPVSYSRHRKLFVRLTIGVALGVGTLVQFVVPIMELPIEETTLCPVFTCLLVKHRGYLMVAPRVVCGIFNVYLAYICWRKIAVYRQSGGLQSSFRRSNFISMIAIYTELLLNFLPTVVYLSLQFFVVDQWNYLGTFSFVFFSTDALVTSVLYHIVVTRRWSKTEPNRSSSHRQIQRAGLTTTFQTTNTFQTTTNFH